MNLLHCTVERAWKFSDIPKGVKWFILSGFLEVILIRGCRIPILDPNHVNSACLALFFWFLVLFFFVFFNWCSISFYWGTWIKPQQLRLMISVLTTRAHELGRTWRRFLAKSIDIRLALHPILERLKLFVLLLNLYLLITIADSDGIGETIVQFTTRISMSLVLVPVFSTNHQ